MKPLNIFINSRFALISFEFRVECLHIFFILLVFIVFHRILTSFYSRFLRDSSIFFSFLVISYLRRHLLILFLLWVSCPSFTTNINNHLPRSFRFDTWSHRSLLNIYAHPYTTLYMLHIRTCNKYKISNFGKRKRTTLTLH